MKAFVITIKGNDYSEACAQRCIASARRYGVWPEVFSAVTKDSARLLMQQNNLRWTWPNIEPDVCPTTGLKRHVYRTANPDARLGCAMSHWSLWHVCAGLNEPILILEHDAVFLRGLPETLPDEFDAIMVNSPAGATPKGGWWAKMIEGEGPGVQAKTVVFDDGRPDGLAGNSAYIISPFGAKLCIHHYKKLGVWPNDATLCRQLAPRLFQVYPFVTEVRQTQSTSGGY